MSDVEAVPYGLTFHSKGFATAEDAKAWLEDYRAVLKVLAQKGKPFGQFADLRGYKPRAPEAQAYIAESMKAFKAAGGQRSIVLFDSRLASMQIKRLAKDSGLYEWERYIDTETYPDFEKVVLAWLNEGKDPDLI